MTRQALATTALSRRGCSAAAARAMTVPPRVQVTDELADYQVAHRELVPSVQHCRSMYLNNRGRELPSADPATRAGDVKRFTSIPLRGLERDHPGGHERRLNVTWDRTFRQNLPETRER